jgi:Domain of unknown function (DUF4249)
MLYRFSKRFLLQRKYWLMLLFSILLSACIQEVDLPIRVEKPHLVVNGLITNDSSSYIVKLSFTGNYTNSLSTPANLTLNGAKVIISDNRGRSAVLKQDVLELGTYRTIDPNFVGAIGLSYVLEVTLPSGDKYITKPEKLAAVPLILELTYKYVAIETPTTPNAYQVYVTTKDPASEQNFYRWSAYGYSRWQSTGALCSAFGPTICYDFCWVPTSYPAVLLYNDANINGNFIKNNPVFLSPIRALGNHFIEVTQYSLSKDAYTFWNLYEQQRQRVGSIFDPQPAPIEGNLVNVADPSDIALGYFGASAISKKKLTIPILQDVKTNPNLIEKGDCRKAYQFGTLERPTSW